MATEKSDSGDAVGYYGGLDVLRLLAVAAVVWIHSAQTQTFGAGSAWRWFAVPAFTATSVFLFAGRHGGDPAGALWAYATRRAGRVYLLFLAWNGIYAAIRFAEHGVIRGGQTIRWSLESLLLSGFAEQLWFLPFLAVVTLFAASPAFFAARIGFKTWPYAAFLSAMGVAWALLPSPITINPGIHPAATWFDLSWSALPSALMVFCIFPFCNDGKTPARPRAALMLVLLAGLFLRLSTESPCPNLFYNAAGVVLVLGAVWGSRPGPSNQTLRKLGGLALPIYLLHPLFVHAVEAVGHRVAHLPVSAAFDGVALFAGLFCSGLAAWFLEKIPRVRWLVALR